MKYQVVRTHTSTYQNKDFISQEKTALEQFEGISYRTPSELTTGDTILITNTHTQLKNLPQDLLKQTKLIIHPNSGYDHFADEHELWKDLPLVVGHSIRAQAVAEYSLGALFEGLVQIPCHMMWNKERTWKRTLLQESNIWIFGYGHIGKIIADTLATLGVRVTVVDPYIKNCPHKLFRNWREGNLYEARAVITATSLNASSFHMFNEEFFHHASPELLFINGARGKLVDENALRSFLLTHPGSFAFLDVFEKEPFEEEWHGFPQVWKTSHIAGVEDKIDEKIIEFEKNVLHDFLKLGMNDFMKRYEKELIQNKWMKGVLV